MKNIRLLLLILSIYFINCQPSVAQLQGQARLDSLLRELNIFNSQDTTRVNLLNDIAYEYNSVDPGRGIFYAELGI